MKLFAKLQPAGRRPQQHAMLLASSKSRPSPSPPSWWSRSTHSPCFMLPRCQRPVQGGPILGQLGSVTLKIHSFNIPAPTLVLSPQDERACRSEGAEVVFRRRVQWRHCRYLDPGSRMEEGSQAAAAVRASPDLRCTLCTCCQQYLMVGGRDLAQFSVQFHRMSGFTLNLF